MHCCGPWSVPEQINGQHTSCHLGCPSDVSSCVHRFGSPIKSMVQRRAATAAANNRSAASAAAAAAGQSASAQGPAAAQGSGGSSGAAAPAAAVASRQPEVDEAGQLTASPPSRRIISRPDIMVLAVAAWPDHFRDTVCKIYAQHCLELHRAIAGVPCLHREFLCSARA